VQACATIHIQISDTQLCFFLVDGVGAMAGRYEVAAHASSGAGEDAPHAYGPGALLGGARPAPTPNKPLTSQ
jgi:hypothetical protein